MDKKDINTENASRKRTAAMGETPVVRRTAWSPWQLVVRILWTTAARCAWVCLPRHRPNLLRLFGAQIGHGCTFARNVEITIPWNFVAGDDCHIADHVILYSLGTITLGNRVRIDIRAHLCAGTHDMHDSTFPLLRPPISIGDDTFIGIDAYIAPDVSLGEHTIVYPRASVYRSFENGSSLQGNPARVLE